MARPRGSRAPQTPPDRAIPAEILGTSGRPRPPEEGAARLAGRIVIDTATKKNARCSVDGPGSSTHSPQHFAGGLGSGSAPRSHDGQAPTPDPIGSERIRMESLGWVLESSVYRR